MAGSGPRPQHFSENLLLHDNHVVEAPRKPLCSKGDSECSSFHLFLSGEKCATATTTQSSANLLSFHLHLSSPTFPESASPIRDTLQEDSRVACSFLVTSELKDKERSEHQSPSIFEVPPEITIPKVLAKRSSKSVDKKNRKQLEEIFNDAVELSVAASEALVISEIVNCEPSCKALGSSIIEAALKVKQTRNEHCLNEHKVSAGTLHEVDEADFVCGMDEISMKEAFEDVGLHIYSDAENNTNIDKDNCLELSGSILNAVLIQGDSSPINGSLVPSTFVSDLERNECLDVNDSFHNLERSCDNIIFPGKTKELLDSDTVLQNGLFDASSPDGTARSVRNGRPACQHELSQTDPNVLAAGDNSIKNQAMIKATMRNGDIVADDGDRVGCIAKERFIRHWLDAGTGKLKKAKTASNEIYEINNGKKSVPKYFNEKVSYISESAVLATEESSVDKPEEVESEVKNLHLVSKEVLTSQDFVGSSNFPSVDPLCSIVPCSISSDDKECAAHVFYQKSSGDAHGNCIHSARIVVEAEGSDSDKATLVTTSISQRRQLASFVAYSKFGPTQIIGLRDNMFNRKQLPVCAAGGINTEQPVLCASLRGETNFVTEIQELAESKNNVNGEGNFCREVEYPFPKKHILSEPSPHKPSIAVLNAAAQSPIVLNYGSRRRLCASKYIPNDGLEKFSEGTRVKKKKNGPKSKKSELNKRVRFAEKELSIHQCHTEHRQSPGHLSRLRASFGKRKRDENVECRPRISEVGNNLISCWRNASGRQMFHGLKFLLTGYAQQKERELEMIIRKNGGIVLNDFPSPLRNMKRSIRSKHGNEDLPLVLAPDKNQTVTFLYGCAVNAVLLRTEWLTDSVSAGYPLAPNNYLILLHQEAESKLRDGRVIFHANYHSIFAGVGIMFCGKPSFCNTYVKIVKRGGGQVFKTLHWLVQSWKNGRTSLGVVVIEDESRASRHFTQCALENKLQILHISWVINCLHAGNVLETNIRP